jgi:hypothetical protein
LRDEIRLDLSDLVLFAMIDVLRRLTLFTDLFEPTHPVTAAGYKRMDTVPLALQRYFNVGNPFSFS